MNSISDRAGDASGSAKTAAARAGDHPVVEWGARLGYAASGVLHLLLAYLTAQIALGSGGKQASQSGALATLAEEPLGQVLLWVIAVGFTLLALWQVTELVTAPRGVRQGEGRRQARAVRRARLDVLHLRLGRSYVEQQADQGLHGAP